MATEGDHARRVTSGCTSAQARRIRVQWIAEIVLVAALYVAYEFARGLHRHAEGNEASARGVGLHLLRWEHAVYLDPEKWLTVHLDQITWLAVPAAYFYATMHYIITPVVLVWLYLRHFRAYGRARTWLGISTMIGLVIFYLVPTMPPRLLGHGYPDVLLDVSSYGWWSGEGSAPRGLGHLTNQLAAMPSMHAGWALWCGVMIFRYAKRDWVRALGVAYPFVTTLVVLSTGNHYLLDVVGGVLVMAVGAALTKLAYLTAGRIRASHSARDDDTSASDGTGGAPDGPDGGGSGPASARKASASSVASEPVIARAPADVPLRTA